MFIKDTDGADDRMQAGDFHCLFSLVCCARGLGATPSAKTLDVASLISTKAVRHSHSTAAQIRVFILIYQKKKEKSGFPRFWGGESCTTAGGHALSHVTPSNLRTPQAVAACSNLLLLLLYHFPFFLSTDHFIFHERAINTDLCQALCRFH